MGSHASSIFEKIRVYPQKTIKNTCFITMIPYVAPQARGQGLGRQLVRAAIKHACAIPELATVRLSVAQDNQAALTLYLSCGFVLDAAVPQDDMLHLQLLLPRPAVPAAKVPQSSIFLKIKPLPIPVK